METNGAKIEEWYNTASIMGTKFLGALRMLLLDTGWHPQTPIIRLVTHPACSCQDNRRHPRQ